MRAPDHHPALGSRRRKHTVNLAIALMSGGPVGIDYSYDVYLHPRDAGRLLTAVATLCGSDHGATTVLLPDATSVTLPGRYGFEPGRTVRLAEVIAGREPGKSFDLAPRFVADATLRRYADGSDGDVSVGADGIARVKVAYTYLSVRKASELLPEHWLFSFTPATSAQSRLFLSSPSIRQTFATLASVVTAPLCLLDVEERYRIVVAHQGRPVSTQVPGPCVLWDSRAPRSEAYRELSARLAGRPPTTEPHWIIDQAHPHYDAFAECLAPTRESPASCAERRLTWSRTPDPPTLFGGGVEEQLVGGVDRFAVADDEDPHPAPAPPTTRTSHHQRRPTRHRRRRALPQYGRLRLSLLLVTDRDDPQLVSCRGQGRKDGLWRGRDDFGDRQLCDAVGVIGEE